MPNFPTKLSEITSEWIATVFDVDSSALDIRVAEGRRGNGAIGFVHVDTELDVVPRTMVAKVPPQSGEAELVRELEWFRQEVTFYEQLAPVTPVRTPIVFASEFDEASGGGIVLMEDCSSLSSRGFLVEPTATPAQLMAIAETAARLHGCWWGRDQALTQQANVMSSTHLTWVRAVERASEKWLEWLQSPLTQFVPSETLPICEKIAANYSWLMTDGWPTDKLTLTHRDFQIGNLFFDDAADDSVVVFDWGCWNLGRGPHDLAYLLGFGFSVPYRRQQERAFLSRYYEALGRVGVTGYSLQEMYDDFRFGCLVATQILPTSVGTDLSNPEIRKIAERITNCVVQNVVDHDAHLLLTA